MNVFIVHAHPEPTSFNGALRDRAVAVLTECGHDVRVSDLYAMGFNPVAGRHDFVTAANSRRFHYQTEQQHACDTGGFAPDLRAEQEKLLWCDALILQFPLWWFGLPGILKGWIDRVMAFGLAYGEGKRYAEGGLRGRRGLISVTTGGTRARFSPGEPYGDIETVLRPVQTGVLAYVGLDVLEPFVAYAAPRVGDEQRCHYLDDWARRLRGLEVEPTRPFPVESSNARKNPEQSATR